MSATTETGAQHTPVTESERLHEREFARQEEIARKRDKKPRRGGLSIQSKLLIMLLAVSVISSVIVGVIGYVSGRESLRASAIDQLTTIREMRVGELEHTVESVQAGVALDSRNLSAQTLSRELNAGWEELQSRELTPEQQAELEQYYAETFIPQLEERTGDAYSPSAFIPQSNAGKWVQYHYTAQFADFDEALATNSADDGTAFSAATERYGDYLTRLVETVGYEDLLVMNLEGDVVYSAYKGVDMGSNLLDGPFRESLLADAYRDVVATNSVSTVKTTDFERWIPSLNVPSLWVVSPIGNDSAVTGALAAQIPIATINDAMTGDERWKEQGLGDTGEVYLVGGDNLMRSVSRQLVEDPEAYADKVISAGTPPDIAERVVEVSGTVLLQPITTQPVVEALKGRTGAGISTSYLGDENIAAYTPVEIDGLNWVAVARIDTAEAFAPVADFTRTLVLSLLAIVLAVSVLSLLLAQVFTRPIRKLVDAVRRVAGGDLAVQVPIGSRDEIGDLGSAFNDMASSLRIKQDLIEEQQVENQKLMLTLMPEAVAQRYRDGEETISEEHDNVSVVFAELVGFEEFAEDLSSETETSQLNALMRGFDEAATKTGVEKVRTLRGGYLASSGLIVPRVDNVRRAVDFAREMRAVVQRFNSQNGTEIDIRAGVDTGTVTSGLVARTSLAYDLWGDAVSLAYRVRSVTGLPGIYVSQAVRDRMQDSVTFTRAGSVELRGKAQDVWRIE
ncbi:adenylate/guanylate cyclase domain-containing protein [Microbacterium sulfonylureivorans]|uniref:adenylate/guanylate cyclase domain-containing protein n=1 Tax=Microbacterium sulfonylureivorans TaxID=2486854 RepID=UPI000FDAAE9C|nr:adenylate/guanylate cyclase domain-containing protein [Microbacterium sulfonylureivorans]